MKTSLYTLASLADIFEQNDILPRTREIVYKALVSGLEDYLEELKNEYGSDSNPTEEDQAPAESEEKSESEPEGQREEEQPKRRARKKKVVEQPKEEAPTTVPTTTHRELRFKEGLDKEVASFSTVEDVDDDKIVNENLGPIPLANSLPKQGEHPFFKGPAQFVWYLDMDRWPLYLADLLETTEFYPDQLSLYDTKRLEEAKRVGVDIEFVTAILNKETRNMVSIEDFKESEYATCDEGEDALMELKESGFLKKFVHDIDPERKLIKFLCRNGRNKRIGDDLTKIYEEHTEHPNKYIHW